MLIKRKSIEQAESSRRPPPLQSRRASPRFAPVTLSEQDGVRYLHFGTEWVQGAMRIRKPDWPELEYAQQMMAWMLFIEQPRAIAQLGLGTATLTKFCYRQFPKPGHRGRAESVGDRDLRLDVQAAAERRAPAVLEMDALDFVNDPANHEAFDVLQCDLYDATARGPVLDTPEFYQACNACLAENGIMTVNLFGDHPSFAKNIKAMRFAFDHVICLPEVHDGNVVALCFKERARPRPRAPGRARRADRRRHQAAGQVLGQGHARPRLTQRPRKIPA
jgi:spermidine synthase